MAKKLVESMETEWNPNEYHDEYEKALKQMLEDKVAGKKPAREPRKEAHPSNVIDLVSILQKSLQGKEGASGSSKKNQKDGNAPRREKAQGRLAPALATDGQF